MYGEDLQPVESTESIPVHPCDEVLVKVKFPQMAVSFERVRRNLKVIYLSVVLVLLLENAE